MIDEFTNFAWELGHLARRMGAYVELEYESELVREAWFGMLNKVQDMEEEVFR